jgi:exodeoxyribonuclease V beta subunit
MNAAATPAATELDVLACPLDGISLIEASAGTGKTWNICGLYLRLLLERGLEVQRILVVTFTTAATAELRERIRQRIVDTLAHLRAGGGAGAGPSGGATTASATDGSRAVLAGGDPFVPRLVAALRSRCALTDEVMVQRLELALATFDEAAIFTIHGFCQRALADTPFTAQMPLAMELIQDDSELVRAAANDFWRRRIAADLLDPSLAAFLDRCKDTPEKYARLLKRHLAKPTAVRLWPTAIDAAPAVDGAALQRAHDAARVLWHTQREAIVQRVDDARSDLKANIYRPDSIEAAALGWDRVLEGPDAASALAHQPEKIDLLGDARLRGATKTRRPTPAHPFFTAAQALLDLRSTSEHSLKLARLRLLRDLLDEASRELRQGKRQRRVVAFDDMLFNLYERLQGGDAPWLAQSLRARFPVALIDEFQDTDPLQWAIFGAVYGAGAQPLFLVGDPKQAIYSFRHADLHTYLQARSQAGAEYTLTANQRSIEPLLMALNGLFGTNAEAFMLPGLRYRDVAFGDKPRRRLVDATEPRAALQVWTLPEDPATGLPVPKATARQAALRACAGEIARLLSAAQRGQVTLDERPLRAGDIAVLVRSHAEGSLVRQALSALGVGSVELSRATVFASPDAEELDGLLAAVLEPGRESLLKAALATQAMGLDAAAIDALAGDEPRLLATVQRFAGYRDAWVERGVGVMLRRWLAEEQVAARLLLRPDGERRLTNLLHLVECLHQASEAHPAPDALLRWFQAQRREPRSDDALQLRLESDQNLVQIVTIHKCKGLEYPVVFCPFLWNGRLGGFPDALDGVEYHDDDGRAVVDFRKGFAGEFDEDDVRRRRKLEDSAESLRLIYVALTRAVHRCVLVAGCYQTQTGQGASATESTRSLLNWLVAGAGTPPPRWFDARPEPALIDAAWARLAARCGPHLGVAPLPAGPWAALTAPHPEPGMLDALPPPARIPSGWWIGSYSSLKHGATQEGAAADHDLRATAVAGAAPAGPARVAEDDILRFDRGATAGDCMHAVFERVDFTRPAGWSGAIATVLRKFAPALGAGSGPDRAADPDLNARRLRQLLADVLNTPLPVGTSQPLRLSDVPRSRRLTELEFHLPSHRLEAAALNEALARAGHAVPRLAFGALRGFLKGYIDLVVEHEGRHFIVDWKSNHLGDRPADYDADRLGEVMAEQGYHLQYLLYSVALDRHLRRRIRDYRPEQHFGGVLYLFVRGVRPGWVGANGRPCGLYFHRPSAAVLQELSALLEPDPAGARRDAQGARA